MTTVDLPLPARIRRLGERVAERSGRAYVVGGSVRDHLLDRAVKDWDVEVHGLELDAVEAVLRSLGRVNAVGRSFGVFKLVDRGREIDVSIPRRDSKVGPGHRGIAVQGDPDMGLHEAIRRRDLTINALMVDIVTGELFDGCDGLADLRAARLRAVDDTTFLEDPLRTLRVVQFAARFDFVVDPTLAALCARADVDELAAERVLGEWTKLLLRGVRPSVGLALLRDTGLGRRLFPERVDDPLLDTAMDRAASAQVTRPAADPPGRRMAIGLLTWLAATSTEGALATLDRLGLHTWLGYPCRDRTLRAHAALHEAPATDADLRHLSTRCELDVLLSARTALAPDGPWSALRRRADALGVLHDKPAPLVQGRDLLALGVRPGPRMGQLLAQLYGRQLDGALSSAEEARSAAASSP